MKHFQAFAFEVSLSHLPHAHFLSLWYSVMLSDYRWQLLYSPINSPVLARGHFELFQHCQTLLSDFYVCLCLQGGHIIVHTDGRSKHYSSYPSFSPHTHTHTQSHCFGGTRNRLPSSLIQTLTLSPLGPVSPWKTRRNTHTKAPLDSVIVCNSPGTARWVRIGEEQR